MTILEIMIVLAIIALVMGFLVGPALWKRFSESKATTAHLITKKFAHEAFTQWGLKNQGCPSSIKDLAPYMTNEETNDPWGQEYILLCGDAASQVPGGFGVMSKGADTKEGTADDIKSWEKNAP
jgi:hypothetical protein